MRATLSILGLYNYDKTIFDNFALPWYNTYDENGDVDEEIVLDSTILIPLLLAQLSELELVYPDLDAMKILVESWSKKNLDNWCKIFFVLNEEYDPIENYNRKEHSTSESGATSGSDSNLLNKVSGFNQTDPNLVDRDSSISDSGGWTHADGERTIHTHGNIGVTTNQSMVRKEVLLRSDYNMYDIIIRSFKRFFCVGVY